MFDFRMSVHDMWSVIYVDNISHFELSVRFLTDEKVSHVFMCSSKKWVNETVFSFV